jgi:hypothetical protein
VEGRQGGRGGEGEGKGKGQGKDQEGLKIGAGLGSGLADWQLVKYLEDGGGVRFKHGNPLNPDT